MIGVAAPAAAHPGGLPGVVSFSASDRVVRAEWEGPADDAEIIERRYSDIAGYVAEHVEVLQQDETCDQDLEGGGGAAGVTMTFTCPSSVDVVTVRVTILLDVNPTYQTLGLAAVASGADRALFTGGTTERDFDFAPGGQTADAPADPPAAMPGGPLPGLEARLVGLASGPLPLPALLAAFALALSVGAAHAMAPGHGKSIAAAYLVAERGRTRDAVGLGVTVAAMHTVSVLGIGLVAYAAARSVGMARMLPWLSVLAGLSLLALGLVMLAGRWRELRGEPAEHEHEHEPAHGHGHEPLSGVGVAAVAAAGGLVPSPSALATLLAAVAAGRLALGLGLVAAFSIGLATAVTLVGVAVLRGRDLIDRRLGHRLRWLPLVGASAVTVAGLLLTATAVLRL